MSDPRGNEGRRFADFIRRMPAEKRDEISAREAEAAKQEHTEFRAAYAAGRCYLCDRPFDTFVEREPCAHWLLRPNGFRKKHLPAVTAKYGVFQLQSFLRWVANEEAYARNICDESDLIDGGRLIEVTIRFKNLEWSFSCAIADFEGHASAQNGTRPHYHFQMRIDDRPFINYNDFHVLLSSADIHQLGAMRAEPEVIRHRYRFGESLSDVLIDDNVEKIVNLTTTDGDPDQAPVKLSTFIVADDGHQISGDDIADLVQEAREKSVTLASLAHRIPNATTTVTISPGPGAVDPAPRPARGRAKP